MDIAYIYSFGMFVKVVDYQTDRVVVPVVVDTEWNTRRPRTWLPTYTRLWGRWVMFSRMCGVVERGRAWADIFTPAVWWCRWWVRSGTPGGRVRGYRLIPGHGVTGWCFQGCVGLWRVMGMSRNLHTCHVMDIRNCWRTRQLWTGLPHFTRLRVAGWCVNGCEQKLSNLSCWAPGESGAKWRTQGTGWNVRELDTWLSTFTRLSVTGRGVNGYVGCEVWYGGHRPGHT